MTSPPCCAVGVVDLADAVGRVEAQLVGREVADRGGRALSTLMPGAFRLLRPAVTAARFQDLVASTESLADVVLGDVLAPSVLTGHRGARRVFSRSGLAALGRLPRMVWIPPELWTSSMW